MEIKVDQEGSSDSWSKEYVEHLRTVHFGLISVSTALILLISSAKPYNPALALRDIEEIVELQKEWSPQWILSNGEKEQKGYDFRPLTDLEFSNCYALALRLPDESGQEKEQLYLLKYQSQWDGQWGDWSRGISRPAPLQKAWDPQHFPNTLAAFRLWWDGLDIQMTSYFPLFVNESGSAIPATGALKIQAKCLPRTAVANSTQEVTARVLVVDDSNGLSPQLSAQAYYPFWLTITLEVRGWYQIRFDQSTFVKRFPTWKKGPFDSAFVDLSKAATGLESLELDDIRRHILDETSKGSEVLEAFGIKFPATQITIWGTVLLIATQLYLWLYLVRLSAGHLSADRPGWRVPWMGMDRSVVGKVVFFFTLVIMPVSAVCLLCFRAGTQILTADATTRSEFSTDSLSLHWGARTSLAALGLVLVFLLSLLLSLQSWRNRPR